MNPQTINPAAMDVALDSTGMAKLRTLLALDRTTLAWIRTALTMATFGFAIAAFFRSLMARSPDPQTTHLHEDAIWFGLALVVLAIVATVLAGASHWLTVQRLRRNKAPVLTQWPLSLALAVLLVVLAMFSLWHLLPAVIGASAAPS